MQILSCAFNYVKLKDSFDSVCMCLPFLHTVQEKEKEIERAKAAIGQRDRGSGWLSE